MVIMSERENWLIDFTATCQAVRCFDQQSIALNDNERGEGSLLHSIAIKSLFIASFFEKLK